MQVRHSEPSRDGRRSTKRREWLARDTWLWIIGTAVGVAATGVTWWWPRSPEAATRSGVTDLVVIPGSKDGRNGAASVAEAQPSGSVKVGTSEQEPIRPPENRLAAADLPLEWTLSSGGQRVVLGGLVGIAIEQGAVGGEEFLTVRISPSDAPTSNHTVLGASGRFEFSAGGERFVVSVLRWDPLERRAVLRLDRRK